MNEDTKNFSALVLRQRLMPEEQLEECLAYQESMSAHGLQKPVWVIALEKGYLKQENYREVVQNVRWIGIRQEDRRFGETAASMGLVGLPEVESALFAQEQTYKDAKKIRRVKDLLAERGLLDTARSAQVEAALASAPQSEAKPSPDKTQPSEDEKVVPVEQVRTMDDLIFPAEHLKVGESPTVAKDGNPALPDLEDNDTLAVPRSVSPDAPTRVRAKPAAPAHVPGAQEEPTVVGRIGTGDPGEEPTVIRKVVSESELAPPPIKPAKTRTVVKKAPPPPPPEDEPNEDVEKTVISASSAGEPAETGKQPKSSSRTQSRAGKTGRRKKGEAEESPETAAAAPKKGPPVVLIAGAAGGLGCLVLVALVVVLVILPMLSPGSGPGAGGETTAAASDGDGEDDLPSDADRTGKAPQDQQPGPADPASSKQPDKPPPPKDGSGRILEEALSKRESGKYAEAASLLNELVAKHGSTDSGRKAAELIETVKAEAQCDSALSDATRSLETGDISSAEKSLEKAKTFDVLNDRVSDLLAAVSREKEYAGLIERGRSLMESSRFSEAADAFDQALSVFNRTEARSLRAQSKSKDFAERAGKSASAGRVEEALELLGQARAALESEGLDVPETIISGIADLGDKARKKERAAMLLRVKELVRSGKKDEAAAQIEEFLGKHGPDKELENLLASVRPKPVRPDPAPALPGGQAGSEWVNPADGSVMLLVPAGEFTMGSAGGDRDQQPVRKIRLSDYRISRHEITNAQFARFLAAAGSDRDASRNRLIYENPLGLKRSGAAWTPATGMENHPVVGVTWFGARAYCQWAGGDLPTEAQWEKAARGDKGLRYPWGNDRPGQSHAVFGPNATRPERVGSKPAGVSPYGALDMAGNAWEWCRDAYSADFYHKSPDTDPFNDGAASLKRVLRGGSFRFSERFLDPSNRIAHPPSEGNDYFGFRLVIQ